MSLDYVSGFSLVSIELRDRDGESVEDGGDLHLVKRHLTKVVHPIRWTKEVWNRFRIFFLSGWVKVSKDRHVVAHLDSKLCDYDEVALEAVPLVIPCYFMSY